MINVIRIGSRAYVPDISAHLLNLGTFSILNSSHLEKTDRALDKVVNGRQLRSYGFSIGPGNIADDKKSEQYTVIFYNPQIIDTSSIIILNGLKRFPVAVTDSKTNTSGVLDLSIVYANLISQVDDLMNLKSGKKLDDIVSRMAPHSKVFDELKFALADAGYLKIIKINSIQEFYSR